MSWSNGESSRSSAHGRASRREAAFAHAGAVRALPPARTVIPIILVVAAAATTVAWAARLVNTANDKHEHGDLVLEEICQGSVTQADAGAACRGVPHDLTVPSVGDRVKVSGSYVLDADHGWMDIHPVTHLTITGSAPPSSPSSAPPAPAGCHPTTSSGNCYEPGEFCPHADAGMTGVAGDGKTITCELVGGYYRWRTNGT